MKYKWAVLLCLMPALTMVMLDYTIVNVALATLGSVFDVNVATVGWVVTGFALATGVATPVASFVETRFTTKRVWVLGLVVFVLGSLLCGLAPAFWVLILGRLIQGVSGGVMFPIMFSALFNAFPENERGGALGLLMIPVVGGPAFGPTIGGYIVTHLDWRWVFLVNLPVGALAVLTAAALLRPSVARTDAHFDAVGAVFSSLAFGSILYGLSQLSRAGWGSLTVQGFVGVGLLSLVIFCGYELTQEEPLLDVRLFALPQFLVANVVTWVSSVALLGAEFMLPLYLQNLRGLSALDTGLLLMPQGLAVGIAGPLAGRIVDRIGARPVVLVGCLLLAWNTWDLSHITLTTSYGSLRWLLIIRGLALGLAMTPTQLVGMAAVPERLRTNASSLFTATKSVFSSFGVAVLATVVQSQTAAYSTLLSWQVRLDTPQGIALGRLGGVLQAQFGLPSSVAHVAAIKLVLAEVGQQAAVLAFGDAYRITFFAALLALLLALLLPGRRAAKLDRATMVEDQDGDLIADLDHAAFDAPVDQAHAGVASAGARLATIPAGGRSE
jgi:MFS transporter, DHA2 family, multidrug resistance protein